MTFSLNSCRIYSTGRTQITSYERIEVYPSENSKVKVKTQNFSDSEICILKNTDKISLFPKNEKIINLNTGDTLLIFHENQNPLKIQMRCFTFFKNKLKVKRRAIKN